jgi:hypothetical protein
MMQRRFTENNGQLPDSNPTSMLKSASQLSTQASGYYLLVLYSVQFVYIWKDFLCDCSLRLIFLTFPTVIRQIFHGSVSGVSGSLQHAQARNQSLQESTQVDLSVP